MSSRARGSQLAISAIARSVRCVQKCVGCAQAVGAPGGVLRSCLTTHLKPAPSALPGAIPSYAGSCGNRYACGTRGAMHYLRVGEQLEMSAENADHIH